MVCPVAVATGTDEQIHTLVSNFNQGGKFRVKREVQRRE